MKKFIGAIVGILATIALASCTWGADPVYVIDIRVEEDGDVNATLLVDQVAVTDATITVQGVAATFDGTQYVVSQGSFSLSSGQTVTVQIQHGELNRTLEMAAPVETTITSPPEGYVSPSGECAMEWVAFSRAPALVEIQVDSQYTASGDSYDVSFDPYNGELSHTFPADTFAAGLDPVVLELKAFDFYNFGVDDPDFDADSVFRIRLPSPNRSIHTAA